MGKWFGTDGIRGTVGEWPMVPEFVLGLGRAAGKVIRGEQARSDRCDRTRYPPIGCDVAGGVGRGLDGQRRPCDRPGGSANTGRGLAGAAPAGRCRGGDLGLPQSGRPKWDQILPPDGTQTAGGIGATNRSPDRPIEWQPGARATPYTATSATSTMEKYSRSFISATCCQNTRR